MDDDGTMTRVLTALLYALGLLVEPAVWGVTLLLCVWFDWKGGAAWLVALVSVAAIGSLVNLVGKGRRLGPSRSVLVVERDAVKSQLPPTASAEPPKNTQPGTE